MTGRIASLFVAVVAGDYAALMLIDGQLIYFSVAAAICAGSSVALGLIAYAGRRGRKAVARGRAADRLAPWPASGSRHRPTVPPLQRRAPKTK